MATINEYAKNIVVHVQFTTDNIGFGGNQLAYFGSKTHGNTKDMQKQDILSQLKLNVIQLETVITELEEE